VRVPLQRRLDVSRQGRGAVDKISDLGRDDAVLDRQRGPALRRVSDEMRADDMIRPVADRARAAPALDPAREKKPTGCRPNAR